MTDAKSRRRFPLPLAYRRGDRDQVLAQLIHKLVTTSPPEHRLTTKQLSDPTVGLLDAWATLADVVDFYQERIATENYLTTATEPESVLALATLLGYRPRPGLAATCWLAYTLVADPTDTAVVLPQHQLVQSVPGAGELPQTFETAADFVARPSWNALPVKLTAPVSITTSDGEVTPPASLIVTGVTTQLNPNDVVLLGPSSQSDAKAAAARFMVTKVSGTQADLAANTTSIELQQPDPQNTGQRSEPVSPQARPDSMVDAMKDQLGALGLSATSPRTATAFVEPDVNKVFNQAAAPGDKKREEPAGVSDMTTKLFARLNPAAAKALYPFLATTTVGRSYLDSAYALRTKTAPFGAQIPPVSRFDAQGTPVASMEWPLGETQTVTIVHDFEGVRLDRSAVLESPAQVNNPPNVAGTTEISRSDGEIVFTPPESSGLDKLSIRIGDDNAITATNVTTGDTVSASLASLLASLTLMPSTVVAQSSTGLTLKVQVSTLPTPQQTHTKVVIEVISALPLAEDDCKILALSEPRDEIVPGSYVVIENPAAKRPKDGEVKYPVVAKVMSAQPVSVSRYGVTSSVTRLELDSPWIDKRARLLSYLRTMTIRAESEPLELQHIPITDSVDGDEIELSGLHPGIETGRRLLITGVRADLGEAEVNAGEVVTVAAVTQISSPGEPAHTKISLLTKLCYSYRRESITLYGNVVLARQGTTVTETPSAAGDPNHPMLTLAQSPVLADPSSTGSGFESSLVLVVDGRVWTWVPRMDQHTPPRCFITGTDGQGRTTITLSQPLPHADSRITATYRTGDGAAGNVRAGQLTQLLTRPLAVATVTNPLPASGGSQPDGPATIRTDAPRGLKALGRVVSVQDAADIALSWAGIGKANATLGLAGVPARHGWFAGSDRSERKRDGNTLFVTVAGITPAPLVEGSALISDLSAALAAAGGLTAPIIVEPAPISLIVMVARIEPAQGFVWETLEAAVRTELVDSFGYVRRDIGQDVVHSEIIASIHRVPGVRSCSVPRIALVHSTMNPEELAAVEPKPWPPENRLEVSGVAYLDNTIVDTLILQEDKR